MGGPTPTTARHPPPIKIERKRKLTAEIMTEEVYVQKKNVEGI